MASPFEPTKQLAWGIITYTLPCLYELRSNLLSTLYSYFDSCNYSSTSSPDLGLVCVCTCCGHNRDPVSVPTGHAHCSIYGCPCGWGGGG